MVLVSLRDFKAPLDKCCWALWQAGKLRHTALILTQGEETAQMEPDIGAFVLVNPRDQPKVVVPLQSVTHHKAQVPQDEIWWSSGSDFKILHTHIQPAA